MDSNLLMTTIVMLRKELQRVDTVIASVEKLAIETHHGHINGSSVTEPDIRTRRPLKKPN
jgi:hypothetical protein